MKHSKAHLAAMFLAAALAGAGLHFLYDLLPNPLTALFSPVAESLWEHLKILFWPYLAAALLLNRRSAQYSVRPWILTAILLSIVMLCVGYLYHIILGGEATAFDIGLYLILMILGFVIPGLFPGPWTGFLWELVLWIAAAIAVALVLFTFWPPDGLLFADLSGAQTWSRIIC